MTELPADDEPADAPADRGVRGDRPLPRGLRWVGELLGELLGEALLAAVSLAVFAVVSVGVAYGWRHDRGLTVGIAGAVALFLGYGLWGALQVRRGTGPRWPRIAAAGSGTLLLAGVWLATVFAYR